MTDTLIRGDDYEWFVKLTDPKGVALPLRNVEVVVVAKPLRSDLADDSDAIYRHIAVFDAGGNAPDATGIRLGGVDPVTGTVYTSPDDGVLTEYLTPADVAALATRYDESRSSGAKTLGVWDLQVTDAQGRRKTLLNGELKMTRDVGRTD